MHEEKAYRIKILDFRYLASFEHLNFRYFTYEVKATSNNEALEQAKSAYMKGCEPMFREELPFLLKLYSVDLA
jgi:hypothetical protein